EAPVAGGVSHGKEDLLVLPARPLDRLRTPGVPVDRVVLVQQQVGAALAGEAVGAGGVVWAAHRGGSSPPRTSSVPGTAGIVLGSSTGGRRGRLLPGIEIPGYSR